MAKICPYCGNTMEDYHLVCANCGGPYPNQNGTSPMNSQPMYHGSAPMSSQPIYNGQPYNPYVRPVDMNVGWGWVVLGFFIPIAGWILYAVFMHTKPNTAKYAGIAGIIGFIVNCIILALE